MSPSPNRLTWAFAVVALLLGGDTASAQPRTTSFLVDQLPQPDGSIIYRLQGQQFGGVPFGGVRFTAPNGTDYPEGFFVEYNSFAELGNSLFGDWTATEHPTSGPDNIYTVRVAPFTLAGDLAATPEITSPIPGSTVPTDFVLKWNPNSQTKSQGFRYYKSTGLAVDQVQKGEYSIAFHTRLLQPPPVPFRVQVFVQTSLRKPTIISRSPSLIGQSIDATLSFNANSLLATYQVVPEPTSVGLVLVAMILVSQLRTRRVKEM